MRLRFRHAYLFGGSLAVTAALYLTDPDRGITTSMLLLSVVTPLLAVGFTHLSRKALHDYPEANARDLFRVARQSPTGAGLALVALSLVTAALLLVFSSAVRAQVPQRAGEYLPVLAHELDAHWPEVPVRVYVAGLVEHESCITLTHPRCWSPSSRLRTQREEGAGLGQLTRAWRADGALRFDALAELRAQHPALRELSWSTIYERPDLQLRALVLQSRGNYQGLRVVSDPFERLAMTDAAYNGGLGGLQRERRACQIASGCDPGRWWGHVELHCLKSRTPLYAGRSACDINRHHVTDVLRKRAPKYEGRL